MIDQPGLHVPAPTPDVDLDPIALDIGPAGQDQNALRSRPELPVLASVIKPLPIRSLAALLPGLSQNCVL